MDPRSAILREQLRELDNRGQPTVPCIRIRNYRPQVVCIRRLTPLLRGQFPPLVPMLPIMQLLRLEQSLHLVRDGVIRVVAQVRGHLVGRRQHGTTRPPGDVQDLLVRRHLRHLHGVNGAHGVHWLSGGTAGLDQGPQLLRHITGSVALVEGPALGRDVRGGVGAADTGEAGGRPPFLDLLHLGREVCVLLCGGGLVVFGGRGDGAHVADGWKDADDGGGGYAGKTATGGGDGALGEELEEHCGGDGVGIGL